MRTLFILFAVMLCFAMTAPYSYAQRSGNFNGRNGNFFGGTDNGFTGQPGGFHGQRGGFPGQPGGFPGKQSIHPPIVSSDGTTYIVNIVPPEFEEGEEFDFSDFDSSSIETILSAITSDGEKTSTTLSGKVIRPFVSEDNTLLAATVPFPETDESVLYLINLPLVNDAVVSKVSLDGNFVSMPFISNETEQIYLTTVKVDIEVEDFDDLEPEDFEEIQQNIKKFLYIIGFDGSVVLKTEI